MVALGASTSDAKTIAEALVASTPLRRVNTGGLRAVSCRTPRQRSAEESRSTNDLNRLPALTMRKSTLAFFSGPSRPSRGYHPDARATRSATSFKSTTERA